jgi:hypothetical protein
MLQNIKRISKLSPVEKQTNNTKYLLPHPEVREHVPPLHILRSQTDLPVGMLFIILKISQRNLKHPMFESFRSNLLDNMQQKTFSDKYRQNANN